MKRHSSLHRNRPPARVHVCPGRPEVYRDCVRRTGKKGSAAARVPRRGRAISRIVFRVATMHASTRHGMGGINQQLFGRRLHATLSNHAAIDRLGIVALALLVVTVPP